MPRLRASCLRATWISQASAAQRSGRAGRLMAGTVYRLYTRAFHDDVMPRYDTPEMLRLSLENVVLKVKLLGIRTKGSSGGRHGGDGPEGGVNSAKAVLAQSIQSPDPGSVDTALGKLAALGALTSSADSSEVTPFGRSLATFPGDLGLGKLVAFANLLGVLGDGIVMAAALAVSDTFLMPHPSLADNVSDYAGLQAKVTRARWMFGLDPIAGAPAAAAARPYDDGDAIDSGGGEAAMSWSSRGAWSEPIALRNAYIAWRCVPAPARAGWCVAYGLMSRRMTAMHSMVREIGHRVAHDAEMAAKMSATTQQQQQQQHRHSRGGGRHAQAAATTTAPDTYAARVVAALIGGDRSGGHKQQQREREQSRSNASWPPPGLFSVDTHVLRLVLAASLGNTVASARVSEKVPVMKKMGMSGVDPRLSVTLNAASAPPEWLATMDLCLKGAPASAGSSAAAESGSRGGSGGGSSAGPAWTTFKRPVGSFARALTAVGVECDRPSALGGSRWLPDRPAKILLLEFRPDWDVRGLAGAPAAFAGAAAASAAAGDGGGGGGRERPRRSGDAARDFNRPSQSSPAATASAFLRALPRQVSQFMGVDAAAAPSSSSAPALLSQRQPDQQQRQQPDQQRRQRGGGPSIFTTAITVRGAPIASAMPVAVMALRAMAGAGPDIKLPQVPLSAGDRTALAALERETGVRHFVPGMNYTAGGSSGLQQTYSSPSAAARLGGRAALPSSAGHGAVDEYGATDGEQQLPVVVGAPNFATSTAWHLLDATTGYRAFAAPTGSDEGDASDGGDDDDEEDEVWDEDTDSRARRVARGGGGRRGRGAGGSGGRGRRGGSRGAAAAGRRGGRGGGGGGGRQYAQGDEEEAAEPEFAPGLSAYTARPNMQSLTRLVVDWPPNVPQSFAHVVSGPLLAVCSGLQLQETQNQGGGSRLVAVMNGMTLLW